MPDVSVPTDLCIRGRTYSRGRDIAVRHEQDLDLGKRPTRPQNVSWGISGSEITRQASMRMRMSPGSPILTANSTSAPGEPTMETKITEQYFQYETNKYFRGNAHSLQLGSFGEKKDPIGAKAYLDVQDAIKPIYLASRVKYNTTTKINWSQTNKTEVEAEGAFKFFGININAAVDGTYDKAKNAKLELISFAIDEGPLQKMLNEDADGARRYLANEGRMDGLSRKSGS